MLVIFLVLLRLLFTSPVYAEDLPTLISPANNSTITSIPVFSWQTVPGSTGYNILIDNEPTVTSPYVKTPYYPTNPGYAPKTLNSGTYYWKVKAKDSNGNWGSFSNIWSFTLQSSSLSSTPTPTPSLIPSPTPTPSLAPAASSTPSPTPKPSSLFTLSNIPSQINSDQTFNASINLVLPNNHNTFYYLSGAFKKADGTRYFGLTKNNSNWIEYDSSNYINQYKITTDDSGNWTGVLEVKPDTKDSDYKGSGDYIFKVARYTSSGSNPVWSDESTIKINDANSYPDTSPVPELTSKVSSSDSPSPTNLQSDTPKISQSPKLTYRIASVAAATSSTKLATPKAKIEVKNQKLNNPFFWVGLIFIFAGISLIGYIYLRKNAKIHI